MLADYADKVTALSLRGEFVALNTLACQNVGVSCVAKSL
jgi:hypothetical protein